MTEPDIAGFCFIRDEEGETIRVHESELQDGLRADIEWVCQWKFKFNSEPEHCQPHAPRHVVSIWILINNSVSNRGDSSLWIYNQHCRLASHAT